MVPVEYKLSLAGHQMRLPKACLRMESLVDESQANILQRERQSAICVQEFDDSLNPAIHITYRILLRSSSLREPRDPSLMSVGWFGVGFSWFLVGHQSPN